MKYIKAKYGGKGASYNFRCMDDDVQKGDIVVTDKGAKLTVTGDTPQSWLDTYGHGKVAEVHKYVEEEN